MVNHSIYKDACRILIAKFNLSGKFETLQSYSELHNMSQVMGSRSLASKGTLTSAAWQRIESN